MPLLCSVSFPVLRRWQISDIVKEKISGGEEEVKKVGNSWGGANISLDMWEEAVAEDVEQKEKVCNRPET